MRTINIAGKSYPIKFNSLAVMEFGKRQGHSDFNGVQKEIQQFQTLTTGNVAFSVIEKLACLVHCGIEEGADIQGITLELTEKAIIRELTNNPETMFQAITAAMAEMMGEQKPATKPATRKGKA